MEGVADGNKEKARICRSRDISSLAFLLRCSFEAKKKEEEKVEEENEIAAAKKERDKEFEKFYSQISSMSSLSDACLDRAMNGRRVVAHAPEEAFPACLHA